MKSGRILGAGGGGRVGEGPTGGAGRGSDGKGTG